MNAAIRALYVAAACSLLAQAAVAADYTFVSVTRAGADSTYFYDINNAGQIAGISVVGDVSTGFVYDRHTGNFTSINGPTGAVSTYAIGISDGGVVVGSYFEGSTNIGFIYESGAYTNFSVAGAASTDLRGISGDGRYVSGFYTSDAGSFFGFVYDRSTANLIELGRPMIVQGINSHGTVAGSLRSVGGSGSTPFLYDIGSNVRTDYGPAFDNYRDINDSGVVAGWGLRDGIGVGLVGLAGAMSPLIPFDALDSFAQGIDNAGVVVGGYSTDPDLLTSSAFIATPVPEPGSFALLLGGLLGLAVRRRRAAL